MNPAVTLYMGKDKVESEQHHSQFAFGGMLRTQYDSLDEDLIKYAWPQDIWFHVDKLSSAHVYLRMPDGMAWESIPEPLLVDCAQLVKANSIEGMPSAVGDTAGWSGVNDTYRAQETRRIT